MKNPLLLFFCFLVFFSPLPELHGEESLPVIPAAHRIELENGLVCLLSRVSSQGLSCVEIWVKAGSTFEDEYLGSGMAHYIEHLLFKGTTTRSALDIEKEIQSYGGSINAFTSYDYTGYKVVVPSEYIVPCLHILSDMLFHPLFSQEAVDRERQVILSEQRLRDDSAFGRLGRIAWEQAFKVHPYRYPVIGYQDPLMKLTRDDVVKWHARYYAVNNMILSIAGNLDQTFLTNKIKEIFGGYPRVSIPAHELMREPLQKGEYTYTELYPTTSAHVMYAFKSTSIFEQDTYALDVLAVMLGQGADALLTKELHIKRDIVYSISASHFTPRYPGLFMIECVLHPENRKKLSEEFWSCITQIKQGYFDEELVETAKKIVWMDTVEPLSTVCAIAENYASNEIITGNPLFTSYYLSQLKKVTKEHIVYVANKYLIKERLTWVNIVPQDTAISCLPANTSETTSKPVRYVLPNGVRLIMQKNTLLPMVTISFFLKGGLLSEPKEQNGISHLTSQLLLKGTKKLKREEISKMINGFGGHVGVHSGNNSFFISASVQDEDFLKTVQFLRDILFCPSFPQEEIEREKKVILAQIKLNKEDIEYQGMQLFKKAFYQTHPYGRDIVGTEESIRSLTRDMIKKYYFGRLAPEEVVVSIAGNFDEGMAKKVVEQYFGFFKNHFVQEAYPLCPVPEHTQTVRIEQSMPKKQALVLLGFKGVNFYGKERYVFDVLSALLSGGGGKVYQRIREKHGLSYSLGFFTFFGIDSGFSTFYVATQNQSVPKVLEELEGILKDLTAGIIQEEDVEAAKRMVIASYRNSLQSNAGLALVLGIDELNGLGFDYYANYEHNIQAITKEQIEKVCAQYFVDHGCVSVIIKSEDEKGTSVETTHASG